MNRLPDFKREIRKIEMDSGYTLSDSILERILQALIHRHNATVRMAERAVLICGVPCCSQDNRRAIRSLKSPQKRGGRKKS